MNTVKAGRRREHKIRDLFKNQGYLVVRAAGSLGPIDLVAIPTVCPKHRLYGCDDCGTPFPMLRVPGNGRCFDDSGNDVVLIQVKPHPLWRAERAELRRLRRRLAEHGRVRIEGWVLGFRKPAYRQFVL